VGVDDPLDEIGVRVLGSSGDLGSGGEACQTRAGATSRTLDPWDLMACHALVAGDGFFSARRVWWTGGCRRGWL